MNKIFYVILLLLFAFEVKPQSADSVLMELGAVKDNIKKIQLIYKAASKKGVKKDAFSRLSLILDSVGNTFTKEKEKADLLLAKGNLKKIKGDFDGVLEYDFKALKLYDNFKDTTGQMNTHYHIGWAYYKKENLIYANKHFYSTIYYAELLRNKKQCADAHSFIGTIFKDWKKADSALFHQNINLNISIELKNDVMTASAYNDIGLIYKKNNQNEKALEYLIKALTIRQKINDKRGIAGANINIGNTLKGLKRNKEAMPYYNKGIELALNSGNFDFYLNGLSGRAKNLNQLGEYKAAASELINYIETKDSVASVELNKQIAELEINYQTEKKDADLKLQKEQIRAKTSENSKQKILIIASAIALILSFIAIFFVYRSFKLNEQNAIQLAHNNTVIEEKNREITDSINYAKLIQQSLLAPDEILDKNLGGKEGYFVLYKPKAIVSGDFYWGSETVEGFLIACVDCTGHGVPGAFMSLIGKENLDKAAAKTNLPEAILSGLNKGVKRSLSQNSAHGNKDGMDAVIIKINKKNNGTTIDYSGANRPLWIIRKNANAVEEIKATKQAVGGFTSNEQLFDGHKLSLSKGDMLYLCTDGYADQFGSNKNKKLTTKRFRDLLLTLHTYEPEKQKQELESFFGNWKEDREQIDDLLVIGIRI